MRGSHYGSDYRWFTRFIGDKVQIPSSARADRDAVAKILAEKGMLPTELPPADSPTGSTDAPSSTEPVNVAEPDLHRVTGGEPRLRREAMAAQVGATASNPYRPGSLKAAMARARAVASSAEAATDRAARAATGAAGGPSSLSPQVAELVDRIRFATNPRDLAPYSLEQLLDAFHAADMDPAVSAKIVQSWAYAQRLSPEEVVAAIKQAKSVWLARANQKADQLTGPQLTEPSEWNYDLAVADLLGQRNNVGQGPKEIDRERLLLLRRLVSSFSGQANYGFTGADSGGGVDGGR